MTYHLWPPPPHYLLTPGTTYHHTPAFLITFHWPVHPCNYFRFPIIFLSFSISYNYLFTIFHFFLFTFLFFKSLNVFVLPFVPELSIFCFFFHICLKCLYFFFTPTSFLFPLLYLKISKVFYATLRYSNTHFYFSRYSHIYLLNP